MSGDTRFPQAQAVSAVPSSQSSTASLLESLPQEKLAETLLAAFPYLAKPHKWLEVVRESATLEPLLEQLLLSEEIRRTREPDEGMEAWRIRRWDAAVQQAFIAQRRRFERVSYYHINVTEQGQAMELYYQICNGEVSFPELIDRFYPPKPDKRQKGIHLEEPLHEMPKPLAKMLRRSRPGLPLQPVVLGKGVSLLQVIEWHPPRLDPATRNLLIAEVERLWIRRQLHQRLQAVVPAVDGVPQTKAESTEPRV